MCPCNGRRLHLLPFGHRGHGPPHAPGFPLDDASGFWYFSLSLLFVTINLVAEERVFKPDNFLVFILYRRQEQEPAVHLLQPFHSTTTSTMRILVGVKRVIDYAVKVRVAADKKGTVLWNGSMWAAARNTGNILSYDNSLAFT